MFSAVWFMIEMTAADSQKTVSLPATLPTLKLASEHAAQVAPREENVAAPPEVSVVPRQETEMYPAVCEPPPQHSMGTRLPAPASTGTPDFAATVSPPMFVTKPLVRDALVVES